MRIHHLFYLFFALADLPVQAQTTAANSHKHAKSALQVTTRSSVNAFPLVRNGEAASICYDAKDAAVVGIAANALKTDIEQVTDIAPAIQSGPALKEYMVIAGTIGQSVLIDELISANKLNVARVRGQWETFTIAVIDQPFPKMKQALVIAGSDRRGTAFGIFELSSMIGVSPFYWWADVRPEKKKELYVEPGTAIIGPPSVKYRGIFINDEKWGLVSWANKNTNDGQNNLGPAVYGKVFELLLRLKANYCWPAMYYGTTAFYNTPANPKLANDYAIVIGSSHCEQMLRNNLFEWSVNFEKEYKEKRGPWRYDLNKYQIHRYWEDRVVESKNYESTYMIGMRGVGDSEMPGPASREEKIKLWNSIVKDQRAMLEKHLRQPASEVPQTFCPYNEVLDMYRTGQLELPDDVTMVWVDDNHGYVRQLPVPAKKSRSGGHGMYYHFSYLGEPEAYIWLSSISPMLTAFEMKKSYDLGISRLWVVNVGDIKPAELETAFFMEMAWDIEKWNPENAHTYLRKWAAEIFGEALAGEIAKIKSQYYELAASGKPDQLLNIPFQTEEADQRIGRYRALTAKTIALGKQLPARLQDAWFQLVQYPVQGAYWMNQQTLYAKRSISLARQGDKTYSHYAKLAKAAHDSILSITAHYHKGIAGGKWDGMMNTAAKEITNRFFNYGVPVVGTDSLYRSAIAGRNPPAPADIAARPKPLLSIAAKDYSMKKEMKGYKLANIRGIGITGMGLALLPFTAASVKGNTVEGASWVEYRAKVPAGEYTVRVKFLPTHALNNEHGLRYAISLNGSLPEFVNLEGQGEHWSQRWGNNVIQGFMSGTSRHHINSLSQASIRIYLPDPGMVLSEISIEE
ncbi:glycosyl hydrolase 115 family protein [Pseudoflavitalea rhizosphaerae]|uniref:glycosyl hydrolase 115 family protein n=1 Tax=Pseudoflavitalea rhizosphaerae TaxID=1884793 RepID=UPI0013DEBCD4|nr:glycosyl hydrolase 115 family protein [Pseudoflavitalea rhizosphaerae]